MVEWNDQPKLEIIENDMPEDLAQAFDNWLTQIEHERNQSTK